MSPVTLREQGFRFTYRQYQGWSWRYEVIAGDVDATEMSDETFMFAVMETGCY